MDTSLSRYERRTTTRPSASSKEQEEPGRSPRVQAQLRVELDAARSALEKSEQHRDELLARVAHDLRGPLNSISGWVQLLQSGRLDPERQQRALDAIARGIHAQTALIDEMQNVSRALRNKLQIEKSAMDLSVPLHRAVEAMKPRAADKSIVIEATIEHDVRINGDTAYLDQVFSRILDNAVRCTPEQGGIAVQLVTTRDEARVSIADSGIGIAREDLPGIFEPFRNAADRGARKDRGFGAGLAFAQRVACLHGGRIEAFSEGAGRGACFVVSLPLLPTSTGDSKASRSPLRREEGMRPDHGRAFPASLTRRV